MRLVYLAPMTAAVMLVGCEKATDWLESVSADVSDAPGDVPEPGGEADEDLAALVKRSEEGVAFRRDLDFPKNISGRVITITQADNMVVAGQNAFGNTRAVVDEEKTVSITDFVKAPGVYELVTRDPETVVPEWFPKDEDVEEEEYLKMREERQVLIADVVDQTLRFENSQEGWRYRKDLNSGNFKLMVRGKETEESITNNLVETGSYPREVWFSENRHWKEGDTLTLTGSAAKLVEPSALSGSITVTFLGEESIGGHPCGKFSVQGTLRVDMSAFFTGEDAVGDVTYESGTFWASMLYPVILMEDFQTVISMQAGSFGAADRAQEITTRSQGSFAVKVMRRWTPEAEAKPES